MENTEKSYVLVTGATSGIEHMNCKNYFRTTDTILASLLATDICKQSEEV